MSVDAPSETGASDPEDDDVESLEAMRERVRSSLQDLGAAELEELLEVIESHTRKWPVPVGKDPVLEVAGTLSGDPVTSEEIDEDLYGEGSD